MKPTSIWPLRSQIKMDEMNLEGLSNWEITNKNFNKTN
jgi:hypothetical protein